MTINPSWVKYGDRHGWLWRGVVGSRALMGGDFWAQAVRVTCAAEGGNVDMVQCYDAGIMTAGPLGATAAFGSLAKLVAEIPSELRDRYLGDLFHFADLGLREAPSAGFTKGIRSATEAELVDAFLAGGDQHTWTADMLSASQARDWVVAFAALLADPAAMRSISSASCKTLMGFLTSDASKILGAGAILGSTCAGSSIASRRATAAFLAFAVNNPKGALAVLRAAGCDADRILDVASGAGAWPSTFPQRVARTRAALDAETW